MHRRLAWDDLLTVLSIGRAGSLAGAARELRVNHSTMFRRITAIEEKLGVRLFDRSRGGYAPTSAGEAVIRLALKVDDEVVDLERALAGEDLRPSGALRVTTTETLLPWVMPILADFGRAYPEIRVELVSGSQLLNLSRRDADVAIRPSGAPPEHLFGRRIGRLAFALFGSADYVRGQDPDLPWAEHDWIGFDDSLSHLRAYAWMAQNVPEWAVRLSASSLTGALHAARAGIGLALLPCYMAHGDDRLVRASEILAEPATDLWLLVHEDIRRAARVRAFTDFAFARLLELRPVWEAAH